MISASKGRQTDKLIKTNNNPHFPLQPHSPLCLTVARSFTLRIFHTLILEVSSTLLTTKTFPCALIQGFTHTGVTQATCSLCVLLLYYSSAANHPKVELFLGQMTAGKGGRSSHCVTGMTVVIQPLYDSILPPWLHCSVLVPR